MADRLAGDREDHRLVPATRGAQLCSSQKTVWMACWYVDQAFFAGSRIRSNFICCLGHGKPESIFPRNPRLTFEEAGRFA